MSFSRKSAVKPMVSKPEPFGAPSRMNLSLTFVISLALEGQAIVSGDEQVQPMAMGEKSCDGGLHPKASPAKHIVDRFDA